MAAVLAAVLAAALAAAPGASAASKAGASQHVAAAASAERTRNSTPSCSRPGSMKGGSSPRRNTPSVTTASGQSQCHAAVSMLIVTTAEGIIGQTWHQV